MKNDLDQYRASNFLKNKNDDDLDQYRADNFRKKRPDPQQGKDVFMNSLRQKIAERLIGGVGKLGGQIANRLIPESMEGTRSFFKGYGQGIPESLYSGTRGISQLMGNESLPEIQGADAENISQMLGQYLGKGVGYGAMAAPIIAGAEGLAPAAIPEFLSSLVGSGAAGAALTPGDKLDRTKGALEFAAPVAAFKAIKPVASTLSKGVSGAMRKVTPDKAYGKIIDQYDKVKGSLTPIFEFVSKQAKERGVNKVNEIDDDLFKLAKVWGPKTQSFKQTLQKAKTGEYDSIRNLYSELGKIGRKADKANDWEKKDMFDEMQDMINQGLESHFSKAGHKDLAQWLGAARSGWAQMKNVFESPHELSIRKLVGENRNFPKTLDPLIGNRKSLQKLLKAVPEVEKDVQAHLDTQELINAWNKAKSKAKIGAGIGLGAYVMPKRDQY